MGQILGFWSTQKFPATVRRIGVPFVCSHAMRCDATGVLDATRRDGGGCFVCVHTDSRRCSFVRSVSVRTKDDESSRVESIDVCVKLNRRLLVGRPTEEED